MKIFSTLSHPIVLTISGGALCSGRRKEAMVTMMRYGIQSSKSQDYFANKYCHVLDHVAQVGSSKTTFPKTKNNLKSPFLGESVQKYLRVD